MTRSVAFSLEDPLGPESRLRDGLLRRRVHHGAVVRRQRRRRRGQGRLRRHQFTNCHQLSYLDFFTLIWFLTIILGILFTLHNKLVQLKPSPGDSKPSGLQIVLD